MKKDIVITSLAMRFPKCQGWSVELLGKYLKKGKLLTFDYGHEHEYYILEVHSTLDVKALYSDGHVGELVGRDRWAELEGMTDIQVLERRNWI